MKDRRKSTERQTKIKHCKAMIQKLKAEGADEKQIAKWENKLGAMMKQQEYYKKWYEKNKNYFKNYYQSHKKSYAESMKKYRQTKKYQEAVQRYESSPKRKMYKLKWQEAHKKK